MVGNSCYYPLSALVAQLDRAAGSYPAGRRFKSYRVHQDPPLRLHRKVGLAILRSGYEPALLLN